MIEGKEMTSLDMFDMRRKTEKIILDYRRLYNLLVKLKSASNENADLNELKKLVVEIGKNHAKCGADLKAIYRLVK